MSSLTVPWSLLFKRSHVLFDYTVNALMVLCYYYEIMIVSVHSDCIQKLSLKTSGQEPPWKDLVEMDESPDPHL